MIRFGPWSVTLLLGSLHGLVMAGLLVRATANRAANRCLAALLLLVVLLITPYTIGYAGFYDAFPWLTFAPFYGQLGMGPLVYLYVRQLGEPVMPRRWPLHFAPLALQVGYYLVLFCLSLETKWRWNDHVHVPFILPVERAATVASLVVYLAIAISHYRRYQRWLADNSGAREEYRLAWLRGFLVATASTLAVAVGFGLVHWWVRPLTYFDEFPLYVVFTLLVYYLGLEGWRNATLAYPSIQRPMPEGDGAPDPKTTLVERDWKALGVRLGDRVSAAQWWREPDIDLAQLARRLGTNTHYLSRALNDGLGMNFSEFINRQRVQAAQDLLAAPGEILGIGFDVGFRSKASFNRAFKAYTGCSPREWRERSPDPDVEISPVIRRRDLHGNKPIPPRVPPAPV